MRGTFVRTLVELAKGDRRVVLLTGDLGYTVVEPFVERFPDRFFNVGVAEQNMVGVATGLAEAGYVPFVYSIAPFAVLRPYEFIRNGPVLHQLPVRVVGVGAGFEYGHNGPSHYGLEDVGVMRIQPGMTVICPADYAQARSALHQTWDLPGPVYYRLGKDDRTVIPGLDGRFDLGRLQLVQDGSDLVFLAMGSITSEAIVAVGELTAQGIACALGVVASLNPAPIDDLAQLLARFRVAVTVEAHYDVGGLGSLVSEVVAERGLACRVVRCSVKRAPVGASGSQEYMYREYGLSSGALVDMGLRAVARAAG